MSSNLSMESFIFEYSDLYEKYNLYDLHSPLKRVQMLINLTKSKVRESFNIKDNEEKFIDERHYLIPGMVSSIYCLSCIYFDDCFEKIGNNVNENNFIKWFTKNSIKLSKTKYYNTLFDSYLIKVFRNNVIVHPNGIEKNPAIMASSCGDFQVHYSTSHIYNDDLINDDLFKIRTLIEKHNLDEYFHYVRDIEKEYNLSPDYPFYINKNEVVEFLFERVHFLEDGRHNAVRVHIDKLVQKFGSNSFKLDRVYNIAESFLPSLVLAQEELLSM